jgi:hypothetical protein
MKVRDMPERMHFARRALHIPLSDVAAQGTITNGAQTSAVHTSLSEYMPQSAEEYRHAVKTWAPTWAKRAKSDSADLAESGDDCVEMEKKLTEIEQKGLRCVFVVEQCEEGQLEELTEKLGELQSNLVVHRAELRAASAGVTLGSETQRAVSACLR